VRRLLRWAFNLAAAISLLLFIATCLLWVRSYWVGYEALWRDAAMEDRDPRSVPVIHQWARQVICGRGGVRLMQYRETYHGFQVSQLGGPLLETTTEPYDATDPVYPLPSRYWGPFRYHYPRYGFDAGLWDLTLAGSAGRLRWLTFPLWSAAVLTGLLPAARAARAATRRIRAWRRPPGCCHQCGYDLRDTPGRCPECGTVPGEKE
jgi:hypothetical protein